MTFLLGTRRGLEACASARGTFAVLALDHRQNLRHELHPEAPDSTTYAEMVAFKQAVVRALAPHATGTLLDPEIGAGQCIADGALPGRAGLLVAIEATGYDGPATARVSRVLPGWSVEQAKRLGASAAKLLVYYHPDALNATDQERLVADVAAACSAADLPLFVEPLGFDPVSGGRLVGEARRLCVIETAHRLTAIGGDILKAEFPYDAAVSDESGMDRRLRRARRGQPRAVGAPLGRRRRRDVRAAGRRRLRRRRIGRAGRPVRLGAGGHASRSGARCVAGHGGTPPAGTPGGPRGPGRHALARAAEHDHGRARAGRRLVSVLLTRPQPRGQPG